MAAMLRLGNRYAHKRPRTNFVQGCFSSRAKEDQVGRALKEKPRGLQADCTRLARTIRAKIFYVSIFLYFDFDMNGKVIKPLT